MQQVVKKASRMDNVFYEVRGKVVAEAEKMSKHGQDVIKLNIGNPAPFGFRTPEVVRNYLVDHLAECEGYSDSKGKPEVREAILQFVKRRNFQKVSIDHIFIGNGVSELIQMCMEALVSEGDEILVPAPDYPLWTASVNLFDGKTVHYTCDESSDWYPDLDDIKSKITPKTKAIVMINPNNPTGAVYPKDLLEKIIEVAKEHSLIIFCDEIYDRLVYDGSVHTHMAALTDEVPVFTLNGLSKSHLACGFRCGWLVVSGKLDGLDDLLDGITVLSSMRLCSNVPAQMLIPLALQEENIGPFDLLKPGGRFYEQRETICNELNSIEGVSVTRPQAAFYVFPKLEKQKFRLKDDQQFALDFLKQKQVLIVQGSGFNWQEPDHFRVVFLPEVPVLKEAVNRLKDFLQSYQQL